MCGELMNMREREVTDRVPGTPQTTTLNSREWVCPDCDYFEDAEDQEG